MKGETWFERAACDGMDTEIFFPSFSSDLPAKRVCARCPVIEECRAATDRMERGVVTHHEIHGIFGGENPTERAARRKREKEEAA